MSQAYSRDYRALAKRSAASMAEERGEPIRLQEGVYVGISGPNDLPGAELTMWRSWAAMPSACRRSANAANHAGLKALGISCITDMASGEALEPLTHEQVVAAANRAKPAFAELVRRFVKEIRPQLMP